MKIKRWMGAMTALVAFGVNTVQELKGNPSGGGGTHDPLAVITSPQSTVGHLVALVNGRVPKEGPKDGNAALTKDSSGKIPAEIARASAVKGDLAGVVSKGKLEVSKPLVGQAVALNPNRELATYRLEIGEGSNGFSIRVFQKEGDRVIQASGGSFVRKNDKLTVQKALDPWVHTTINDDGVVLSFGEFHLTLRHRKDRHGVCLSGIATDRFEIQCHHIVTEVDGYLQFDQEVLLEGNEFINNGECVFQSNLRTKLTTLVNDPRCTLTIKGDWNDDQLDRLHIRHDSTFNVGSVHARGTTICANAGTIVCDGDWSMPKCKMSNCERTDHRGQFLIQGNCQLAAIENVDQKERFNVCEKMFGQFASTLENPEKTYSIWASDHEIEFVRFQLWNLIGRPFLPWFKLKEGQESSYSAPKDPFAPYTAEEDQLWQLYANAWKERNALRANGLGTITLGKNLTPEQQKALGHDMVWLVETKLPPWEKILTLRVFLCENTLKSLQVGPSNLVAGSMDLSTTGNFTNEGLMEAINGPLKVHADGMLLNQGGALLSDQDVQLTSKTAVINQSGTIEGKTGVHLSAPVIVSETTTEKIKSSVGHHTLIGGQDAIQSDGNIVLSAGNVLAFKGTQVAADGDVVLSSAGDLHLGVMENTYESRFGGRRWNSLFQGKTGQSVSIRGQNIDLKSQDNLSMEAPQLTAKNRLQVISQKGNLSIEPFVNTEYAHSEWRSKRSLGSKSRGSETRYNEQVLQPRLRAYEALLESELDLDTAGLDLEVDECLRFHSKEGKVRLRAAKQKNFYQQQRKHSGIVTTSVSGSGRKCETVIPPHLVYGEVEVTGRIFAEIAKGNLEPWVVDLSQAYEVDLRELMDQYETWAYHQTQMAAPLRTFLSVGMAIVTQGWGTQWAAQMGISSKGMAVAMGKAMEGIVNEATVSLIANGGDLGKVWNELSSSKFIKNLVASALAEGIIEANVPKEKADFGQHLKRNLAEAGIKTGVHSAIEGGKAGNRALQLIGSAFVDTGAQCIARDIGAHYANGTADMGYLSHKLMHFVLGAAAAAAKDQDPIAGAIGATIGEVVAEKMIARAMEKTREEVLEAYDAFGLDDDDLELLCLSSFYEHLKDEREHISKAGQLAAAGTAWVGSLDIQTAADTAKLAVEYNSFATIDTILREAQEALLHLCEKIVDGTTTFFDDYGGFIEPVVEFLCPPAELVNLGLKYVQGEGISCTQLASAGFNILPVGKGLSIVAKGGKRIVAKISAKYNVKFWNKTKTFQGVKVYQRNDLIDLTKVIDKEGRTNLQRMQKGLAPIGPDKIEINLHHMLQSPGDPLAEITATMHSKYTKIIHINPRSWKTTIDRRDFKRFKKEYWKNRALDFEKKL